MTGPAFGISLTIDSAGSKAGAAEHIRSIEQVKAANASLTPSYRASGSAAQDLFERQQSLAAGTALTADELRAMRAALEESTHATGAHVAGLGRVERALGGLALSATGANSHLGHVGLSLLGFGAGGPLVVGVAAGLAVIGGAYELLTKDSRDLETAVTAAAKAIDSQATSGHDVAGNAALLSLGAKDALHKAAGGTTSVGFGAAELQSLKDFVTLKGLTTDAEAKEEVMSNRVATALKLEAEARYAVIVASKDHLAVVASQTTGLGGLIAAHVATSAQVAVFQEHQERLRDTMRQYPETSKQYQDAQAALNTSIVQGSTVTREQLAIGALQFQQQLTLVNLEHQLAAARTGGIGAADAEKASQDRATKAVNEAGAAWTAYLKLLPATSALQGMTIGQAASIEGGYNKVANSLLNLAGIRSDQAHQDELALTALKVENDERSRTLDRLRAEHDARALVAAAASGSIKSLTDEQHAQADYNAALTQAAPIWAAYASIHQEAGLQALSLTTILASSGPTLAAHRQYIEGIVGGLTRHNQVLRESAESVTRYQATIDLTNYTQTTAIDRQRELGNSIRTAEAARTGNLRTMQLEQEAQVAEAAALARANADWNELRKTFKDVADQRLSLNQALGPDNHNLATAAAAGQILIQAQDDADRKKVIDDSAAQDKRIAEHAYQTSHEIRRVFAHDFTDLLSSSLPDWASFFDAIAKMAADAAKVIGDDIAFRIKEGLHVSDAERIGGGLFAGLAAGGASHDAVTGAVGGAATGFEVAGPLGLVAGAVGGFVSGLFGESARAKEAARLLAENVASFQRSLDDLAAIANPRGALGDALQGLTDKFVQLVAEAAKAAGVTLSGAAADFAHISREDIQQRLDAIPADRHGGIAAEVQDQANAKLRKFYEDLLLAKAALDAAAKAEERRIALERQQLSEDLNVRNLRAQGLNAEADALAQTNQAQREFEAAVEKYGASQTEAEKAANAAIIAQLGYTQGLEREAFLKAQTAAAQDKLNQATSTGLSLDAQLASARGDTAGALGATLNQQIFDISTQLEKGLLTPENAQKSFDLAWQNYRNGMKAITDSTDAAAQALRDYNAQALADARQRGRAAGVDIAGAGAARSVLGKGGSLDDALVAADLAHTAAQKAFDDATRHADHQQRLDDAAKAGADATTIAAITEANRLDDMAAAARDYLDGLKKLNDATKAAAALTAAENSAREDLNVRLLRAQGQNSQADQLALHQQHDQELQKYRDQHFSDDFIKFAQSVFAAEEGKLAADQYATAAQALTDATTTAQNNGPTDAASIRTATVEQFDTANAYLAGILSNTATTNKLLGGKVGQVGVVGGANAGGGVVVNVTLDGDKVAKSVDTRQGSDVGRTLVAAGTPPAI